MKILQKDVFEHVLMKKKNNKSGYELYEASLKTLEVLREEMCPTKVRLKKDVKWILEERKPVGDHLRLLSDLKGKRMFQLKCETLTFSGRK